MAILPEAIGNIAVISGTNRLIVVHLAFNSTRFSAGENYQRKPAEFTLRNEQRNAAATASIRFTDRLSLIDVR
jgi:hypothetical protein